MTGSHFPIRIPLRRPLGGLSYRYVTLVEGSAGWGEFSPLAGYPADPARCWEAAAEAAMVGWPTPVRTSVGVNGLIPALGPDEAAELALEWAADHGPDQVPTVKVKVGDAGDLNRIAAIRMALGPKARIRVDANGAWDPESARTRLMAMSRYDLELAEQPVADLEDLARLRRRVPVILAADECLRATADVKRLVALAAADAVVLKVQPLGGVRPALAMAEVALEAGVGVIVTSMWETSVGVAAGLALACALPALDYACGLGGVSHLGPDVVAEPLVATGGRLTFRIPVPDPERLAALARDGLG